MGFAYLGIVICFSSAVFIAVFAGIFERIAKALETIATVKSEEIELRKRNLP